MTTSSVPHGSNADDAAWAMLADAAERAFRLSGLTHEGRRDMWAMAADCRRAAGLDMNTAYEAAAYSRNARFGAFEPVRNAIEEAMDVPGLSPEARADLAVMHDTAAHWCGARRLRVPTAWTS